MTERPSESARGCGERHLQLAERLAGPLPGISSQERMAPAGRVDTSYDPEPPNARTAAVLIALTRADEILFIRRALDGSAHSGQIAFPGGEQELADSDLTATALREAHEEIGLQPERVQVLGRLSPLYIPVSNFVVYPIVGCVDHLPAFVCQPDEVDEVLLIPVDTLARSCDTVNVGGAQPVTAPCYRVGSVSVWGATAMIAAEFLDVWRASNP